MSLEVRIQHHPSRRHLIPSLLESLASFDDIEVVPDPGASERQDAWRAHRACLNAISPACTSLLVLQDDVIPQDGFENRIGEAVQRWPESVVLAFVPGFPRERRLQAMARKTGAQTAAFIVGAYVPTVAILYPRSVVDGLLAWADTKGKDRYRRPLRGADDGIVANYCRLRRIHPLMMVPCAVEHDETIPSIGKNARHGPHRRAALLR